MAKRYIHGLNESVLVEDGSAKHEEMLESGEWFNDRCDVPAHEPVSDSDSEEDKTVVVEVDIDYSAFTDEEIVSVYNTVDAEMEKRGLYEGEEEGEEEGDVINLEELTIDELRALAQKHKIPGFYNMKQETLIKKLMEVANA